MTPSELLISSRSFSFRCPDMVKSFFENAAYPKRVFIAIIQQNTKSDVDCVEGYCKLINKPLTQTASGYENSNGCDYYDQVCSIVVVCAPSVRFIAVTDRWHVLPGFRGVCACFATTLGRAHTCQMPIMHAQTH